MPRNLRNPDGTVNFAAVNAEVNHLKGKYAQNVAILKKNMENFDQAAQQNQPQANPQGPHVSSQATTQQQSSGENVLPRGAAPQS